MSIETLLYDQQAATRTVLVLEDIFPSFCGIASNISRCSYINASVLHKKAGTEEISPSHFYERQQKWIIMTNIHKRGSYLIAITISRFPANPGTALNYGPTGIKSTPKLIYYSIFPQVWMFISPKINSLPSLLCSTTFLEGSPEPNPRFIQKGCLYKVFALTSLFSAKIT